MGTNTNLTKIDQTEQAIANITTITQAKRLLAITQGYVVAATKEYKVADTIPDGKEDKSLAYDIAVKAGELRLKAEARLGELIKQEQEAGRLATQLDNLKQHRSNNDVTSVKTLKDYGLTKIESSRAQQIAEHKDLIPKVISSAIRIGDIPTRKSLDRLIRKQPKPPVPTTSLEYIHNDNLNIYDGDFSQLYELIKDNSVDLFFTDPPYDKGSLNLFSGLAQLAQAKLKPGGLCLAYSGQSYLSDIFSLMSQYLDYWWVFAIFISGNELRLWSKNLWVRWKPVIAFTKRPSNGRITDTWFCDYTQGGGADKRFHKWGQPIQEATYWIESLVPISGLVVDPFCGGGTIPLACKLTNRNWIATESNPETAEIARKRVIEGLI